MEQLSLNISPVPQRASLLAEDQVEMSPLSSLERWLVSIDDDLRIYLLWFVHPVDLINLATTSIVLYSMMWHYRTQVWSLDNFLRLWFPHPQSFIQQLTLASAIISSSQVIRFFDRLPPRPDCDLDIFTRVGSVLQLGRFLFSIGFILVTEGKKSDQYDRAFNSRVIRITQGGKLEHSSNGYSILSVFNFVIASPDEDVEPLLKVQLIVVNTDPIDFIIHTFHSTTYVVLVTEGQKLKSGKTNIEKEDTI
ncbi:hypothetical protein BKA70DRAFT_1221947 [Coprinopsis sp. MPI-PUGE-AT-0042]|nr:hypothetical protein BKA70DRAFT_1221947 [Coprinopsis sp. MPI-PUGE-AT-0042]